MVTIQVKRNLKLQADKAVILHAAQLTLDMTGSAGQTDMGIVIGDDVFIKNLNHKFRQVDAPTDVLSFPTGEVDPDTTDLYLGDVVISLPCGQGRNGSPSWLVWPVMAGSWILKRIGREPSGHSPGMESFSAWRWGNNQGFSHEVIC